MKNKTVKTDTPQRRKWREKRKKYLEKYPEKRKLYNDTARKKLQARRSADLTTARAEEYKWRRENRERWLKLQNKSSSKRYHDPRKHQQFLDIHKRNRDNLKREVLSHYSPELKCQRCGFSDIRALSIDHINGEGGKQKREVGHHGLGYYLWLRRNNFPSGLQVLCMNCQFIKKAERNENPNIGERNGK